MWYNNYKPSNWVCNKCKKELPPGVIGISKHWSECEGKGFTEDLKELSNRGKLNLENVEKLRKKHFSSSKL